MLHNYDVSKTVKSVAIVDVVCLQTAPEARVTVP
jgi:hypothetical protein